MASGPRGGSITRAAGSGVQRFPVRDHIQVQGTHLGGGKVDERADALGQLATAEVAQVVAAIVRREAVQAGDRQSRAQGLAGL